MSTKNKLDLAGQTFGQITVIERSPTESRSWVGTCSCKPDVRKEFNGSRLASGKITDCGCKRVRHGHTSGRTRSGTYISWQDMKARCKEMEITNPDGSITKPRRHLSSWNNFNRFLADMGERPKGTTLDRIDTLGHYTKANCRWATRVVQDHNKTNTAMYFADPLHKNGIGSALDWAGWYTRVTGIAMTPDEFRTIMKFISAEQFYCCLSPLTTYQRLMETIKDEKEQREIAKREQEKSHSHQRKIREEERRKNAEAFGDYPISQDEEPWTKLLAKYGDEDAIAALAVQNGPPAENEFLEESPGQRLAREQYERMKKQDAELRRSYEESGCVDEY